MSRNKKHLNPLGETEMEVLQHVWNLGSASVAQVHEIINTERKTAYTTIMTVMKNLADKGYLDFTKEGVTYIYSAKKKPEDVRFSLMNGLMQKVFGGSALSMVKTLVNNKDISREELDELKKIISNLE